MKLKLNTMNIDNHIFTEEVKSIDAMIPGIGAGLFDRSRAYRNAFDKLSDYNWVGYQREYSEGITHERNGKTIFLKCLTLSKYYKNEDRYGFINKNIEVILKNAHPGSESIGDYEFKADLLVIHGHNGGMIAIPGESINKLEKSDNGAAIKIKFKISALSALNGRVLSNPIPNHTKQLTLF